MDYSILVKKLRMKMLLTQQEFAKELGVSFASVNRWKNKKYEPTMKEKRELQKYFIKYKIVEE